MAVVTKAKIETKPKAEPKAKTKMVNGRADANAVARASRVLSGHGLTVSAFIRNSIEHVARTGEVPESGMPVCSEVVDRASLQALISALEAKAMPGKAEMGDMDEDELVDRLRMERYGY